MKGRSKQFQSTLAESGVELPSSQNNGYDFWKPSPKIEKDELVGGFNPSEKY